MAANEQIHSNTKEDLTASPNNIGLAEIIITSHVTITA
tara:strand:+ start:8770 stop:8883 length:114 start_codon:yes stop_codon:yes gene_type:complete